MIESEVLDEQTSRALPRVDDRGVWTGELAGVPQEVGEVDAKRF